MLTTISINIQGRVQGVYFRQSTRNKARELGLKGIVKNLPDNSVQIIATGTQDQLQQLINWCHTGPPRAIVEKVKSETLPLQNFNDFSIMPY